jgi:methylmalonyl-CoA mutase cobalamin-binding subunit
MKNNNNLNFNKEKRILVASLGQCVHRAGIHNFMTIAEQIGFNCTSLSPTISNSTIIKSIKKKEPNILGLSYRLTPSTVEYILKDFFAKFDKLPKKKKPKTLLFAGIPEVVKVVKRFKRFDFYFEGGEHRNMIIEVLENNKRFKDLGSKEPMNLISRINRKNLFPSSELILDFQVWKKQLKE